MNVTLIIASALHFHKVENISLYDVQYQKSYGFGVHLLDSGRVTSFQNISIQNNYIAFITFENRPIKRDIHLSKAFFTKCTPSQLIYACYYSN